MDIYDIREKCIDRMIDIIEYVNVENHDDVIYTMGKLKAYANLIDEIDICKVITVRGKE